jgi:hypothetical protein
MTGVNYYYDVWQPTSDRAYVGGCVAPSHCTATVVYSYDGTSWTQRTAPPGNAVYRLWGRSDDDIWLATTDGVLFHHGP